MAKQAPSSSSITYQWTYDVFLNFRGEDTRFDFTRNLYNALDRKGIHVFIDDDGLRRGEEITPALVKAIEESRIAITIFSKNYASSTFCLDELVRILECVKEKGRLVLPVFYDVDPSEVRHQRENYKEAFAKHEKRFEDDKEKVRKWRVALHEAANLCGLPFKPGQEYEYLFIERIAQEVSRRVNRCPFHIADYPIGIEARVQRVISLLDLGSIEGVQMVGICGIGGIGKTTIARAVYNLIVDPFDGICFIADVRENSIKRGVVHLQEMLLFEIFGEDIKLVNVSKGIPITKLRLQQKKVLLVLDDVDDQKQLQALAGGLDWFGSGSRIIITTRDKHLLARHGIVKVYEVESLNTEESLELLTWNAFGQNRVDPSYMEFLKEAVLYAGGLPLALEVIGSNLFDRGVDDWSSALDTYRRIPIKKIQQILQISYDALEENEREIFLDIACCFNGDKLEYVRTALYARGICPDYGIKVLVDKCLIKIHYDFVTTHDLVTMHDLVQEMGREIVRQQSPKEPGERTRLWFYEDILQVLEENKIWGQFMILACKGTKKIEAINLDMPRYEEVDWNGRAFEEMPNLKILIIRNARFSTGPKYLPKSLRVLEWNGYSYPSLPSDFYPKKLVVLKMSESCLKLDEQIKKFQSLSIMNFQGCKLLTRVPDLSGVPSLKELCLDSCPNLIEVHHSVGFLNKLKRLTLIECKELEAFPAIRLPSLEHFDLSSCRSLQRFPEVLGIIENISYVSVTGSGIEELPLSFRNLIGLQKLHLKDCRSLRVVRGISPNLKELLEDCLHLNLESRSILLSQVLHEVEDLKFVIQNDEIPEWLDHYAVGHSVSFWIRKKFPDMAICFSTERRGVRCSLGTNVDIKVRINGIDIGFRHRVNDGLNAFLTQRTFLFDMQGGLKDKLESLVLGPEWNHVQISCLASFTESVPFEIKKYMETYMDTVRILLRINWVGVYVYKKKFRMVDVRFTNPSEESPLDFLEGSSTNRNSLAKEHYRELLLLCESPGFGVYSYMFG